MLTDVEAAYEELPLPEEAVPDDALTIPSFLDRRGEALGSRVCAQCRAGRPDDQPTVEVRGKNCERLWVHARGCLRFWQKENSKHTA
jgi:hypothetical protein